MPNIIKPKRSNTASSVPTTANLADGEIAVNSADKKIYLRDGSDIVVVANYSIGEGGGISNVVEDTTPQLGGNLDQMVMILLGLVILIVSGTLTAESTTQTLTVDINQSSGTFTGNVVDVGYVDSTLGRRSIFQIAAQSFRYDTTNTAAKTAFRFGSFTSNTGWVGLHYGTHPNPVVYQNQFIHYNWSIWCK